MIKEGGLHVVEVGSSLAELLAFGFGEGQRARLVEGVAGGGGVFGTDCEFGAIGQGF